MKNSIIVSGIGCITPFGRGLKEAWSKIIRGESAFTSVSHSNGNKKTIIKHHKRATIPDKVINSL
ncbi:MAG: beta-ketoacyl synthase N-terminal-like domain-containing protein, partial [Candidatus Caldatribacteriota bacterium]|nr:beta-ketoacyl synthase N-terminal-like domain-containing protein [Candidatus Caldatribacteriota bacterium]